MYTITTPAGVSFTPPFGGRCWGYTEPEYERLLSEGRIHFPRQGRSKPRLKQYESDDEGLTPNTWWTAAECGSNDAAKNHIQDMFPDISPFDTPKPERLLQRIIDIATNPDDIVLDCFAGSGTTAATAHKMHRRWITIEASPTTLATYTLPRLAKVVSGEDAGGISTASGVPETDLPDGVSVGDAVQAAKTVKALAEADLLDDVDGGALNALLADLASAAVTTSERLWAGGGGFAVLDVGPSMFEVVGGRVYLADWVTNGALAEATAAQLHYTFDLDPPFAGRKGKVRLAVVDGLVNEAVVRLLLDALPGSERLCVCGTAVDPDAADVIRSLRPGSSVRKVPESLLDEYRQSRRSLLRLAQVLDARPVPMESGV
jgi:adenine-specific DNA-methyltransferase